MSTHDETYGKGRRLHARKPTKKSMQGSLRDDGNGGNCDAGVVTGDRKNRKLPER